MVQEVLTLSVILSEAKNLAFFEYVRPFTSFRVTRKTPLSRKEALDALH